MTNENEFGGILPEDTLPEEENRDNDISADEFESSPVTEQEAPQNIKQAVFDTTAEHIEAAKQPVSEEKPEEAVRAEIVYNNSGEGGYTCDMRTTIPKKKRKTSGAKVAALIIAALFTLTFMTYVSFSIADALGAFDMTEKGEVFQMELPEGANDPSKNEAAKKPGANEKIEEVLSAAAPGSTASQALTVNQIAEKCRPSSVGIMVETEQYYFGRVYTTSGVGSGFILSEDGYIATNNHVIEGATRITVVLDDGSEHSAELIGADSITDIAVVKIEAEGLPVMERGNSDELSVGDLAVAIGTPASIELAGTVTDGIISAVGRKIDITDNYGRVVKTMNLIQTNATINPGNSGGPLINRYGQVIGINTLKLTDEFEGIGFAIPINGAISIMNQLIRDGEVTDRNDGLVSGKASIGIQCYDITADEAEYYGIPQAVMVMQVNRSSSAAKAGLSRGDIIVKFNGSDVKTTEDINRLKDKCSVGDEVTLTVFRDSQNAEVNITFKLDMQVQ